MSGRNVAAFLAGFGGGYVKQREQNARNARQAKIDEREDMRFDREQKEWEDKQALKTDLADAAAPRATMEGTVLQTANNKLMAADPAQAAALNDTLAAEAELKGEAAPSQSQGTAITGKMARGHEIATGPVDVDQLNSPDARGKRVSDALYKHGQIERAMTMEGNALDIKAKKLGLDVAQLKFADDQFNRRLNERLSEAPDWTEAAVGMLSETQVGGLAGSTLSKRVSDDGKSVEFVASVDGKDRVLGKFENSDAGKAKFLQTVARVPVESKIGWIVEDNRATKEQERWQQTFDFNKKKEENDEQYRQRVLGIQMAQEARSRQTHAATLASNKIPQAVKMQADSLAKQLEGINSIIHKSMADGQFDANGAGFRELRTKQSELGIEYQKLLSPYTPSGAVSSNLPDASAFDRAADASRSPAPSQPAMVGMYGGAVPVARPSNGAQAAAAAPSMQSAAQPPTQPAQPVPVARMAPPTVAQVLAGPGAANSPALQASAQQKVAVIEDAAARIREGQAAVAQAARSNPNAVPAAMQQVQAARAELNKQLQSMNAQQASQVLAALGLQ